MTSPPGVHRRTPLVLLFGQGVLGLVVGVVWWSLTRHPATWMVGEPVVTSTSVYPIARDGVFTVLTGLVGFAAALVVVTRGGEPHRPLLLFASALGGAFAGALIAAGLGTSLPPSGDAAVAHVTLRAWVAVLVQPFVVSVVVAVVTLVQALLEWTRTP
ncbi:hypothetical protein [Kineococcus rhizosphaerae]|uniref:Uncharacterized protein n=1 Tax=Kineococcus rhizosphaerae TaxID=559628 RepID=A0A2T0R8T2_9ACTN|nr:hypothetical protein [Kineococcus rhizosphaerae]PRY17550.1 hypothetical protein CLV37_102513 [Kineococcus rhizosphaerae]